MSGPPNILFIMTDDHAAHALGCYGSRINRTPNLDRIAAEGTRFDRCFCTNNICEPSRAATCRAVLSDRCFEATSPPIGPSPKPTIR